MLELLKDLDTQLLLFLNSCHTPFWDTVMFYSTKKFTWIPLYVILLFFIFREYKQRTLIILVFSLILVGITDQVAMTFKEGLERWRPCRDPEIGPNLHLVKEMCRGRFGFFSAHAATSFAIATFISRLFNNKLFTFFMFTWAAFISYTRIYLGAHFPGDILAGAFFGLFIGWINFKVYNLFYKNKTRKFRKKHVSYSLNHW